LGKPRFEGYNAEFTVGRYTAQDIKLWVGIAMWERAQWNADKGHAIISDHSSSDEDVFQATEGELKWHGHNPPILKSPKELKAPLTKHTV
jgi:hypothetical protein